MDKCRLAICGWRWYNLPLMTYTSENAVRGSIDIASFGILGGQVAERAALVPDPHNDALVLSGINTLRANLAQLVASPHPDDTFVSEVMCDNFVINDAADMPPRLRGRVERPVVQWMINASNSDFVDLLRWNSSRMATYQKRLDKVRPELNYNAVQATDHLVRDGILPHMARPLMQEVIHETRLIPLDSFEAGKFACVGYFNPSTSVIGMTHAYLQGQFWTPDREVERVHRHEAFHALRFLVDGGLSTILPSEQPDDDPLYTWFDEMFNEHLTQAGENGQPHILNPDERWDGGSYGNFRRLGSLGFCEGPNTLPLDLLGHAYLESSYRPGKYRRELHKQLCALSSDLELDLGHQHLVGSVARSLQAVPATEAEGVAARWISDIHAARGTDNTWNDLSELPTENAQLYIIRETVTDI